MALKKTREYDPMKSELQSKKFTCKPSEYKALYKKETKGLKVKGFDFVATEYEYTIYYE